MGSKHRIALTALLTALMIVGVGLLRPTSGESGLGATQMWLEKVAWGPQFDFIIAGDSRVYRGVSPQTLGKELGGRVVANFGFSGLGYESAYFDAVEARLAPSAQDPVILLGITPHSLTPVAVRRNGFLEVSQEHPTDRMLARQFAPLLRFVRPIQPVELIETFDSLRGQRKWYYQHFHADGWVASRKVPETPSEGLTAYHEEFAGNQVSPEIVATLLERVRQWREAGIRVFGFRPPTNEAMVALEDSSSGFDEPQFVQAFEQAGGTWLAVDQYAYHSYDSSHLDRDAAVSLSRDIARRILTALRHPPSK